MLHLSEPEKETKYSCYHISGDKNAIIRKVQIVK